MASSVPQSTARRTFLADVGMGFTGLALGAMLNRDGVARAGWAPPTGQPHFPAKAKSVIWLFMAGGISQMESFDPKPMLNKYGGKSIAETPFAETQDPKKLAIEKVAAPDANGQQRNVLYPLQVGFQKRGESGIEISDWFPHIGSQSDMIAVVRSMWTTDSNHGAQTQFHTGRHTNDGRFPTVGAWVHYGLGALNDNLPQFISLSRGAPLYKGDGNYLGPSHDSVPLRVDPANPLDFGRPAYPSSAESRDVGYNLLTNLNRLRGVEYPDDPALAARIASYELAFRMQTSIPDIIDFSKETQATQSLYGLDKPNCKEFGMQLLAARRFVEQGVRFIQVRHGGPSPGAWDAHKGLKANHEKLSGEVDLPVAGLLQDLDERGLLDETLVVFCTEFGRTPGSQGADGRDHHIFGFSIWMAGGGLKRGVVHGATDEIGFHGVEDRHYVTDVHATILHQLGLDSRKLEIPGRKRLEIDHGKPMHAIIA
ncbi:MAG TPA: DUF1501 domain-containing protein [Caulifigura sp.]|nr:DUF1501 domain-containing protein [Caulifigura sp.]